jgi:hypothetical protein
LEEQEMKGMIALLVRLLGRFGLVLVERNASWVLDRIGQGVDVGLVLLEDCREFVCWLRESGLRKLTNAVSIQ